MRLRFIFLLATNLLVPTVQSIPLIATDEDGDAVLTLTVEDVIRVSPPSVNWCSVAIDVDGDAVVFSAGDLIEIWVYEDDILNDDLLFDTSFVVTAAEVLAQQVIRLAVVTARGGLRPASVFPLGFARQPITRAAEII